MDEYGIVDFVIVHQLLLHDELVHEFVLVQLDIICRNILPHGAVEPLKDLVLYYEEQNLIGKDNADTDEDVFDYQYNHYIFSCGMHDHPIIIRRLENVKMYYIRERTRGTAQSNHKSGSDGCP